MKNKIHITAKKNCLIKRRNLSVVLSVCDNLKEFLTLWLKQENFGVFDGWSHMEVPLSAITPYLYLIECN